MAMKCPIWDTPADLVQLPSPSSPHFRVYSSSRAGGRYRISGTAEALAESLTRIQRKVLTTWLCKQRNAGISVPQLDEYNLDEIKTNRPMRYTQRAKAALLHFDRLALPLNEFVRLGFDENDDHPLVGEFIAQTESENLEELIALLETLKDQGYLIGRDDIRSYAPTASGWERIDELAEQHAAGRQAFVAMWFDPSMEDAYLNGFHKAIRDAGYDPQRIDKKEHNNKIDDEIIAEIRRSRFLVADFTCNSHKVDEEIHFIARGGVYFEAGYAMALPIPVIWSCKDTAIKGLHFDTRQYAHIVWSAPDDLYRQLRNRIGATIGDGQQPRS
jgi:hypothetical protein